MSTKILGNWGEEQAVLFLCRQGYRVVERNFHSLRGEIDIVAVQGGDYYFIEVKTREAGAMATDDAITFFKKQRLKSTVGTYLAKRNLSDVGVVLAGLLVSVDKSNKRVHFRLAVFIDK